MNERLDEIIKNVVYIDKGASELRGRVDEEIKERKKHILDEIQLLKSNIDIQGKDKIRDLEERELSKAKEKSDEILNDARLRVEDMKKMYEGVKDELIKSLFDEILNTKNI